MNFELIIGEMQAAYLWSPSALLLSGPLSFQTVSWYQVLQLGNVVMKWVAEKGRPLLATRISCIIAIENEKWKKSVKYMEEEEKERRKGLWRKKKQKK